MKLTDRMDRLAGIGAAQLAALERRDFESVEQLESERGGHIAAIGSEDLSAWLALDSLGHGSRLRKLMETDERIRALLQMRLEERRGQLGQLARRRKAERAYRTG